MPRLRVVTACLSLLAAAGACSKVSDIANPTGDCTALVEKCLLCESASSAAAVERVNDMLPADALALTHFLHGRLKFVIGPDERGISPGLFRVDVVDACALRKGNSPELEAICERERKRLKAGIDIGFFYEGPGAVELVARLNELYGIDD